MRERLEQQEIRGTNNNTRNNNNTDNNISGMIHSFENAIQAHSFLRHRDACQKE